MEVIYRVEGLIRRGKVITAFKIEKNAVITVSCTHPEGRLDLIRGNDILEKSTPSFVVSASHPEVREAFFNVILVCYEDVLKDLHATENSGNPEFYARIVMTRLKELFKPYELAGMRKYFNRDIQDIVSGVISAAKIG